MSKTHMGSSIDAFLKKEGIFEETQAQAIKEVVAWQLAEAMKQQNISKNKMATLLKTSRTQVDRLLDPKNDITLGSLQRAAAMVGRRVNVELVVGGPTARRWQASTRLDCFLLSPGGACRLVESLMELRALTDAWLRIYNGERPPLTASAAGNTCAYRKPRPPIMYIGHY